MSNTKKLLDETIKPNHYFPEYSAHLKVLHHKLDEAGYINKNEDFERTFELRILSDKVRKTTWNDDKTKAYYLLYRLSNREDYFLNERIDKIAMKLFTFSTPISKAGGHANFAIAYSKFEDPFYLEKKMGKLLNLLNSLGIK